jgi:hypothetical protein
VGLIGVHAMKIRVYIPQFLLFCWAANQEAVACSMCMVWRALLDWYCLMGGGRGLWLVATVGLAHPGFVQK